MLCQLMGQVSRGVLLVAPLPDVSRGHDARRAPLASLRAVKVIRAGGQQVCSVRWCLALRRDGLEANHLAEYLFQDSGICPAEAVIAQREQLLPGLLASTKAGAHGHGHLQASD